MAMPIGSAAANIGGGAAGGGGGGGGGEMPQRVSWVVDERDGFISWLRSEFAAANAIIDAMCHHLRGVGDHGEYEYVIAAVQQRRYNWNPILHMQQYFPIAEVVFNLQQVAQRRQQRPYDHHPRFADKEYRKAWQGHRQVHRGENWRENHFVSEHRAHGQKGGKTSEESSTAAIEKLGANEESSTAAIEKLGIADVDSAAKIAPDTTGVEAKQVEGETLEGTEEAGLEAESNGGVDGSTSGNDEIQSTSLFPKQFVAHETFDGKSVNVVEGLKLYENLFDSADISKLFFVANELRSAGRKGEFQGSTYVASKRPMKGHGREMLQFGPSIADGPTEDANGAVMSTKEHKVDEIPGLLQYAINRIHQLQIMSVKPDSCIVDFYHEGDHSHPHLYPYWYGRPVCVLSLNECDMVFGRMIGIDNPGHFRGSLNLTLTAGSLLVMQGKSADISKHAIPSLLKQRILVTFMKRSVKKSGFSDTSRLPFTPQMSAAPSSWAPALNRSSSRAHHQSGTKQYGMIPATGVLPAPAIRPQLLPAPSGMQPLFAAAPVASAVPFPAPVTLPPSSATWQPVPPRHSPPRLPLPGTGVFLPPGSAHSSSSTSSSVGETNPVTEASEHPEVEKCSEGTDSDVCVSVPLPVDSSERKKQDCDGNLENGDGHLNGQKLETKLVDTI